MERTPGRNWINTGYGANVQSVDFGSPSGGRGKPVKMYVQPFSSPPVIGMRSGAYNGGYPMCIVYPQVSGHEGFMKSCITRVFSRSVPFATIRIRRHESRSDGAASGCLPLFCWRPLLGQWGLKRKLPMGGVVWCPGPGNSEEWETGRRVWACLFAGGGCRGMEDWLGTGAGASGGTQAEITDWKLGLGAGNEVLLWVLVLGG